MLKTHSIAVTKNGIEKIISIKAWNISEALDLASKKYPQVNRFRVVR